MDTLQEFLPTIFLFIGVIVGASLAFLSVKLK